MNVQSQVMDATLTGTPRTQWSWHLGGLAIVGAVILATFQNEVSNAFWAWWIYPAYSHCFLIIPIFAWLVWERRHDLAHTMPAVAPKGLFAIPVIMLIWVIGEVGTVNELRQFMVVALIDVAIYVMLGARVFRLLLFPELYLFFLVPFGQYLIPPMQQFATWFSDIGLSLLGVIHYTEGTLIELPNGIFEIAEACAGLRFLIATFALGVLFAHLTYRRWWKIGTFLVACILVPLIANGLRCTGTIALAYFTNNAAAVAADHIVYGWAFNVAILLVMCVMGMRFRDAPDRDAPDEVNHVSYAEPRTMSHFAVVGTVVATIFGVASGPAFAYWKSHWPVPAATLTFPSVHPGWAVIPTSGYWSPIYSLPDQELKISLAPQGRAAPPIDVAILYYASVREKHSPIETMNRLWNVDRWHGGQYGRVDAHIGTAPVRFSESIIESVSEKRIVWSSYWMDGQFTTSRLLIKLLQVKGTLIGHRSGALIAFSTPIEGAVEDSQARLTSVLAALNDLPKELDAAGSPRSRPDPLD